MRRGFLHISAFALTAIFVFGCSTEKNTRISRAYHNVTSRYNVSFNANESLKSGEAKIEQTVKDDFTRLLPIYKDSDPSTAKAVFTDMDNVILKASKQIKLHSITKKPKRHRSGGSRRYQEFSRKEEFNNWIDDSYLLMGKAYFYQDNFISAIENLTYIIRKFPNEKTKYEAYLWLIRSYTELERFVDASDIIQTLEGDNNFPKRYEKDLAIVTADYYIKMKEYDEAIKYLDIATRKIFWKKKKARLKYILAQLYEITDNKQLALQSYEEVVKLNPSYAMAFNARIKAAGVFSGEGDMETLKKELKKMLNDEKNIEYRDQIYYAIGNIYYKEGDTKEAIGNYRNSVSSSVTNSFQLAQSAITLADIYFADLNYRDAQAYYDSAMIVIDDKYPNYNDISVRYKSLSQLVGYIVLVEREDSLQRVALMDETERDALIDNLIKAEQEKKEKEEEALSTGTGDPSFYRANQYRLGIGGAQSGSGWYFYNPQTVSFGKAQFQQRWGKRKLEDDWRRSDKSTSADATLDELAEKTDSIKAPVREDDPMKREFYLQDLPLNDSLMYLSHERIKEALYNAGKLFKSEFTNYERSSEAFEDLNKRYPGNIYTLSNYFDLYDNNELVGNQERSNYYKNLIIQEYPDSKYAKFLLNPNFFIDLENQKDSLNRLYEMAFDKYKSGKYPEVITLTGQLKELEPDSMLIPKIDFLRSVSMGTQSDNQKFEALMKDYITNYPKEETTPLASEILSLIQDSTLSDYQKLVDMGYLHDIIQNPELNLANTAETDEFGGKFSYDEDLLHYFIIAYPKAANPDINRLKFDIANYNLDNYTRFDFDIETETLDGKTNLLIVRSLENKDQSLIYFRSIIRKNEVFRALDSIDYISIVASSTNYREILAEKSLTDYLKFFVKNYSRFIKPEFEDEELLDKPEELMAKEEEEESKLQEQGTFVMVSAPQPKDDGLFSIRLDTAQYFVIAIKGDGAPVRPVVALFNDFNKEGFRSWNLQAALNKAADYQLVVIKGIPSLNEGMSYFRRAVTTRSLFADLENISYRNFLITEQNLKRLVENGKLDDYMNFFRQYYLQTNTQAPATQQPKPEARPEPSQVAEEPKTAAVEYSGPFNTAIEKPHIVVFVVAKQGIDEEAFKNGLSGFAEANNPGQKLTVTTQPLDDFRNMIQISELPGRNAASQFFSKLVADRNLFVPLGQSEYRNFIITHENLEIFIKNKNITMYMDFYKKIYLGQ